MNNFVNAGSSFKSLISIFYTEVNFIKTFTVNLIRDSYTERQRLISSNDNKWQLNWSNFSGHLSNINVRCSDKYICIGSTIKHTDRRLQWPWILKLSDRKISRLIRIQYCHIHVYALVKSYMFSPLQFCFILCRHFSRKKWTFWILFQHAISLFQSLYLII
jgi:hypothetical protein